MFTMQECYSGRKRWAVYAPHGALVCVCLYKKGARNLLKYLNGAGEARDAN